jgi:hypothetical protein
MVESRGVAEPSSQTNSELGGKPVKRVATAVLGGLLTILGLVLLVLPGPGVILVAAGLAVLAREFTWAERPLNFAMKQARDGLDKVSRSLLFATLDALTALALVAVGVLDLVIGLPVLEVVSDVFLMLSGLFMLSTVVYARRRGQQAR